MCKIIYYEDPMPVSNTANRDAHLSFVLSVFLFTKRIGPCRVRRLHKFIFVILLWLYIMTSHSPSASCIPHSLDHLSAAHNDKQGRNWSEINHKQNYSLVLKQNYANVLSNPFCE